MMNNEIKEKIRQWYIDDDLISILDYITNLQEEIKRQEKAQVILDNQNAELQERINNAIEYMIKQRDVITDYVHQAKEINEDYLFLDRTSLETFKNIYEILQGE